MIGDSVGKNPEQPPSVALGKNDLDQISMKIDDPPVKVMFGNLDQKSLFTKNLSQHEQFHHNKKQTLKN